MHDALFIAMRHHIPSAVKELAFGTALATHWGLSDELQHFIIFAIADTTPLAPVSYAPWL